MNPFLSDRGGWVALLAGALIAAAIVSGCGSGGGGSSEATLTKDEFVRQADAICKKANPRQAVGLHRYIASHKPEGSQKAWEEELVLAIGLPPIQAEAKELGALGVPAGGEEQVTAIIEAIEEAVEKGKKDPAEVTKPPGSNTFAEAEKMARAYGLKVCGEV